MTFLDSSTAPHQQQGHRFTPLSSLTRTHTQSSNHSAPAPNPLGAALILPRGHPGRQSNKRFILDSPEPSVPCSEPQPRPHQSQRRQRQRWVPTRLLQTTAPHTPRKEGVGWGRSVEFNSQSREDGQRRWAQVWTQAAGLDAPGRTGLTLVPVRKRRLIFQSLSQNFPPSRVGALRATDATATEASESL